MKFWPRRKRSLLNGTRFWVGGDGRWSDEAHWSDTLDGPGGLPVPTAADDVVLTTGATVRIDRDTAVRSLTLASFCGTLNLRSRRTPWYWLRTLVGRRPRPTVTVVPDESDPAA